VRDRRGDLAVRHKISGCSERGDGITESFSLVFVDVYQHDGKLKRRFLWEGTAADLDRLKAIDAKLLPGAIRPYLQEPLADRPKLEAYFSSGKFESVSAADSSRNKQCRIEPRLGEPSADGVVPKRGLSFVAVRGDKTTALVGAPIEVTSGTVGHSCYWLSVPWIAVVVSETGAWAPGGTYSWQAIRFFKVPAADKSCFK
jgi:hypothetical protein